MGLQEREQKTPDERWAKALEGMPASTRQTYDRELGEFLSWANETRSGLVAYWTGIMNDPKKNMGLSDAVGEYLDELDDRGFAGGKQNSAIKAVRKFFKVNGYSPVLDVKMRALGTGSRAATKEEINKILAYAIGDPRIQAVVATIKDNGLRPSDIVRIQVKHIQPILDDPELQWHIFKLPVLKTKRLGKIALPAMGPDSIKYLRMWLFERERLGFSNSDPEAFIFVNIRDVQEYEKTNGKGIASSIPGEQMKANNLTTILVQLCERAGVELSANSFRKFNTTRLSMGGLSEDKVKFIQGKHNQSSLENYLDFQAGEILPLYQKAYGELSLDVEAEKFEALESRMIEQENTIMVLKESLDLILSGKAKVTTVDEILKSRAQKSKFKPE